LIKIKN